MAFRARHGFQEIEMGERPQGEFPAAVLRPPIYGEGRLALGEDVSDPVPENRRVDGEHTKPFEIHQSRAPQNDLDPLVAIQKHLISVRNPPAAPGGILEIPYQSGPGLEIAQGGFRDRAPRLRIFESEPP